MTAQIFNINGQPVQQGVQTGPAKVSRCEDIARVLDHMDKLNERGELKAIVVCAIQGDDSTASAISIGRPIMGELFLGALDMTKDLVKRTMPRAAWIPPKNEPPKGA